MKIVSPSKLITPFTGKPEVKPAALPERGLVIHSTRWPKICYLASFCTASVIGETIQKNGRLS
jgi:hypothetical protein